MGNTKSKTCDEAAILQIVKYPHKVLCTKARSVEKISEEIFGLAESMTEAMLKYDGVGLAANQVGQLWRVCVVNATPFEDKPSPIVIINPKIIRAEGSVVDEEGCLSFPGLYINVERSERILVQMQNLYSENIVYEAKGLLARALQHEIDHLDGVVFIDRALEQDRQKVKEYLERST
jgi:peptide deformylase